MMNGTGIRRLLFYLKLSNFSHQNLAYGFISKDFPRFASNTSSVTETSSIPVIKYPISFKRKLIGRRASKKNSTKGTLNLAKPGKLLISSSNKLDNMYTNEFCSNFNPPTLTSATWTSYKSPGRHFTIHPTRPNPSLKIESSTSFEELGLSYGILDVLGVNHFKNPTVIQSKAIPEILNGKNVMLAAETGSGKTLAYLLPIFHHLLALKESKTIPETRTSPLALVLAPTRELVQQVVNMAQSLELPVRCQPLGSISNFKIRKKEQLDIADILVATPVALLLALHERKLDLCQLRFAVVDECDTLLDDSFSRSVVTILKHFNIKEGFSLPLLGNQYSQLILSSATYPKYANEALKDIISLDNVVAIRSGYLHRVATHVKHRFMRVKPSEKFGEFIKVLEASKNTHTIVFCNFQKTAKWLHTACTENAVASLLIEGKLDPKTRSQRLKEFLEGDYRILITTDLLSRGLDTKRVEQVINYEIPENVSDYLHRTGRVGRVGQEHACSVTSLVSKKWEIPVVMQIEEAARRREEIGDVSANIKRQHKSRWAEKNEDQQLKIFSSA